MSRKTVIVGNFALAIFWMFVGFGLADEITLNVNVKKPVAVVSEKFLSITLDPVLLFNSNSLSDVERTTSMAKALSPAYVRISGPRSNSYVFTRGPLTRLDSGYSFTENDWVRVQQWAAKSGLQVISSIAPLQSDALNNARTSSWDPRNALDLISFSDHMGYNTSWQLGFECQTRCEASGEELAREVQRLRGILDAFPRYASERSLLAGPDVVTFKTRQQQQYLQEFFAMASPVLGAITWHPDFAGISLEAEGVSMHHDNLALDKDSLYRIVGRYIAKKPLWIAESRPEECKHQFLGALVWARRLGNSAKLGFQVLMRQPNNSNLFKLTPDYWVSMLHKKLVGREVLDTRIASGNRTHVHFYCHCTKPSDKYEKGSLTVFGINLTPSKITASLKGLKLKTVHKYILLPGYDAPNRMFSETILLNNQMLSLVDGKKVPDLQPTVSNADKGVKLKLPSGGIGFWVLPGLNVKSCMGHEDETPDKNLLKKFNKRLEETELEENTQLDDEDSFRSSDTIEERKALLRQQLPHRRLLVRRCSRHEKESAVAETNKAHKRDTVQYDFDRFATIMKNPSNNLKSGNIQRFSENIDDEDNQSSEESPRRAITGQRLDSGEVIRAKLQHYKKRLDDHENKKKQQEMLAKELMNGRGDLINKGMDTQKVIEALALMTNVESALKKMEKTLGTSDFTDITAALSANATDQQRSDSEALLSKVLNTEMSKMTSVPPGIEDQLKALYQLLSEEQKRKEGISNPTSLRRKRDAQKDSSTNVKPVDLRRDVHRRTKIGEAKERRNERKQRIRGKIEQKRDQREEERKELDSDEDNFYGFHQREPIKNFPNGDVYIQTSTEKKETGHVNGQGQQAWSQSSPPKVRDEHENMWLEEGEGNHMPNEFYENVKGQGINTRESSTVLSQNNNAGNNGGVAVDLKHEIITERQPLSVGDHQANQKVGQQPPIYHDLNENGYNFEDTRRNQREMYYPRHMIPRSEQNIPYYHHEVPYYEPLLPPYQQEPAAYLQDFSHYQHDPALYQQDPFYQQHLPQYQPALPHYQQMLPAGNKAKLQTGFSNQPTLPTEAAYHRVKRQTNDLEDEMHQEMISQDDNNLRDCQCRVIRGEEDCKDCIMQQETESDSSSEFTPSHYFWNDMESLERNYRFSRDVKDAENKNENTELVKENVEEKINSTPDYKESETVLVSNSDEQHKMSEEVINIETTSENSKVKEEETTTVNTDNPLELVNDNDSESIPPNRLPRKTAPIPLMQFFPKNGGYNGLSSSNGKQESTSQTSNSKGSATSSQTNNVNKLETTVKRAESTYSSNQSTAQTTSTTPSKITQIIKAAINKKQTILAQNSQAGTINHSKINTETVTEPNTKSIFTEKSEDSSKISTRDAKETSTPNSIHQTTSTPIPDETTVLQNVSNAEDQSVLKSINKPSTLNADSKSQMKNNSTHSIGKQMRQTTRSEALAALRRENERKRAKKMMETSLKILESENARFAEYQKRQQEQIEKLKLKLRAKREKMLQQYRNELLEVVNESPESNQRTLHRRDLIKSMPDKYSSEEVGFIGPQRQTRRRRLISRSQASINNDDDNNKYAKSKDRKRRAPIYEQFGDDEIDNLSSEQEFQTINQKRSPFSLIDREQLINKNDKKFEKDDSIEYHAPLQHHTVIPLNIKYNQPPSQHQIGVDDYLDANNNEQNQQENVDEREKLIKGNYGKSKRSDFRIVGIDPWLYDEYQPEYYFQELRPSNRFGSRNYRHKPTEYINRRFRREADFKIEDSSGPSFFSLGLEKSKMKSKKIENTASLESSIRKKRVSDGYPDIKSKISFQLKSPMNKNIKKVFETDYNYKYRKTEQNKKQAKNMSQSVKNLKIKDISKFSKTLNELLSKEMFSKSLNYVNDNNHGKYLSIRRKRSTELNEILKEYQLKSNEIDRSLDPELDEIWNNIIEMKQDEELLKEYKEKKNEITQNFRDTQRNLNEYFQSTTLTPIDGKHTSLAATTTTQTNIESMLVDAIPKLQNVITGGLEKAKNVTGSVEDFIENFDHQSDNNGTESSNIRTGNVMEANDESMSHNVFRVMVNGVKKFFNLVSSVATVFHGF